MGHLIEIDSFNPYVYRFPNRKLISKDVLRLIKYLRQDGHEIVIRPKNSWPVEYLFQKGALDLFTNPIYVFFLGVGANIASTLIANAVQKVFDNRKERKKIGEIIQSIFVYVDHRVFQINGKKFEQKKLKASQKNDRKLNLGFEKAFATKSPFPLLATPIFFEHQPKIVGWGKYELDENGFVTKDNRITDMDTWNKIKNGEIQGGSITGIAKETQCNICNSNYILCNHVAGDIYNDKECFNLIIEADAVEFSLVRNPINPHCLIDLRQ